jgi:Flp pilus assembly protein TadG
LKLRVNLRRGGVSLPLLIVLVPVLFGLMGFALDLGRLYLVRGELNQAASAMALAAAEQLIGTDASLGNATTAASQTLDNTNGFGNKYNFGSLTLGVPNGNLSNTINPPEYFATVAAATGTDLTAGQADGTTARHALIGLSADAPLLFWSLLTLGQSRKTTVAAVALAGISAPLCTACGIVPFAVAPIDPTDTVNFGFGDPTAGIDYTFAYACTGAPAPVAISGGGTVVPYVILNRYDAANATLDETGQLYRDGAQGLLASTDANPTGSAVPLGCVGINDSSETVWASAAPGACSAAAPASVADALCGLYTRLDTNPPAACTAVTDFVDLSAAYATDTDVTTGSTSVYASYTGNGRRVITIAIVNSVTPPITGTLTVLGFLQFLVEPAADGTFFNPADSNGRFPAQYIGSPAPVKGGYIDDRFALGCPAPVASGPGKVVLHQ